MLPSHDEDGKSFEEDFNLTTRNHWCSSFLVSSDPLSSITIGTTTSEISYQLGDIYFTCMCCWNVATYKWKIQNWKIEIISSD